MNWYCTFGIIFFLLPFSTSAQVLISEIAWMGTDADANNEWIELYNLGATEIDLAGWALTTGDGSISIVLGGTLASHGVGVLERTDDTTLPQITALLTYTGALANGGTTLTLKDGSGVVSDQVVGGSGWESIGGSNTVPKKTPQRTRTGTWITASPTPGSENTEVSDPVSTTTTTSTTGGTHTTSSTRTSGGGGSSKKPTVGKKEIEITNPILSLAFLVPKSVYVNEKLAFEATPSGIGETLMNSLVYTWNFGDTYTETGKKTAHIFTRPGTYTVVLRGAYAKYDAMVRYDVTVLPTAFEITRAANGDIVVHNESPEEINLGGFALGQKKEFVFPPYTFVRGDGALTIPRERLQKVSAPVALLDAEGIVLASEKSSTAKNILNTPVSLASLLQPFLASTPKPRAPKSDLPVLAEPNEKMQVAEVLNESNTETIIQIGKGTEDRAEPGFMSRVMQKITALFRF